MISDIPASIFHSVRRIGSRIYFVLVQIPVAFIVSVLALAASAVIFLFSGLLCLSYRIVWYLSPQGRLYRGCRIVEKCKEKINKRERLRRIDLSRRSDRENIRALISIILEELDRRKNEIMIDLSVLVRIQLRDCMRELDFDTAMEIYQVLSQTQTATLNQRLERQVGMKQKI